VHFELSDEQIQLQGAVEAFCRAWFREQAPGASEATWVDPWKNLTAMGLTGILVPEELGGSGGTLLDACLVAEQLGRGDAQIPFIGTSIIAAAMLVAAHQSDVSLPKPLADLAAGAVFAPLVDDRLRWPAPQPVLAFDWRTGARGVLVSGGDPVAVVDKLAVDRTSTVDPSHPARRLAQSVAGSPGQLDEPQRRALAAGQAGLAAWLTGVAAVGLDDAVEYAKSRHQFGVPIGSFQAVQHMCADMFMDVETSRSIAYGAAWTVENRPLPEAERVARAAKSWCARAAIRVCETSIQVFGGIGITAEHRAHRRLRNAHQFAVALGGPRDLNQALGRAVMAREEQADGPQ
jgi:alkylation response protein AidB-like acyl-CoA dehydrogenase